MERINYGVIGLGFFGEKHAEVVASLPNCNLYAVCTRRPDRLHEIQSRLDVPKAYQDYSELVADPHVDAVSVVTHVDDHLAPTVAALQAGKHVLTEKPMARTPVDCDKMIKAAEKANRILMVGHICRFNPRYAVARERIDHGELGDIVSMYARRNIPAARSESVLEKISPLLGDGIHDTDLILWMSGARVEFVYALTHNPRRLKHPDIAWAMYRFYGGAIGVIENVWFLPEGTPFRIHEQLEVIGTKGALYVHGNDTNLSIFTEGGADFPDTAYWPIIHGEIGGALRAEITYFIECVLSGIHPTVITPQQSRTAVAVLSAAEASARTGKVIKVRY